MVFGGIFGKGKKDETDNNKGSIVGLDKIIRAKLIKQQDNTLCMTLSWGLDYNIRYLFSFNNNNFQMNAYYVNNENEARCVGFYATEQEKYIVLNALEQTLNKKYFKKNDLYWTLHNLEGDIAVAPPYEDGTIYKNFVTGEEYFMSGNYSRSLTDKERDQVNNFIKRIFNVYPKYIIMTGINVKDRKQKKRIITINF